MTNIHLHIFRLYWFIKQDNISVTLTIHSVIRLIISITNGYAIYFIRLRSSNFYPTLPFLTIFLSQKLSDIWNHCLQIFNLQHFPLIRFLQMMSSQTRSSTNIFAPCTPYDKNSLHTSLCHYTPLHEALIHNQLLLSVPMLSDTPFPFPETCLILSVLR